MARSPRLDRYYNDGVTWEHHTVRMGAREVDMKRGSAKARCTCWPWTVPQGVGSMLP